VRSIILSEFVSLDGFYAGPEGDLDWVIADEEHHSYSAALLDSADLLLFGSRTYRIFRDYWPKVPLSEPTPLNERSTARQLNAVAKIVYSRQLGTEGWNTSVRSNLDLEELRGLKAQTGRNIIVFGSGVLAQSLMRHDLIDEYHLLVQPVALSSGKAMFANLSRRLDLQVFKIERSESGVIRLYYRPILIGVARENYASNSASGREV
jgi:dihydrofolate reductase